MELKHIKVFISAAEHLNFSKVAELSYISQPSVTKYIQALEGELGGKLFYRNSQKLELSDFGKAFLPYARELLATEQQSLAALDRFRSGLEYGRLTLVWKARSMSLPQTLFMSS